MKLPASSAITTRYALTPRATIESMELGNYVPPESSEKGAARATPSPFPS
jgi:hypothetical protein